VGRFLGTCVKNSAKEEGQMNTIVKRVRRTSSMTFVARFRSDVVACPIDADGRIVCVRSIDGDVSAGSEPRGVIPWDTQLNGSG